MLRSECNTLMSSFLAKHPHIAGPGGDVRVKGGILGSFLTSNVMSAVLPKLSLGDLNFRHEWVQAWYGHSLDVDDALETLGFSRG